MNTKKYVITATSRYAFELLKGPFIHGTVHSVYRKTVNLSFNGQLLALQAAGSPLSPISLITNLTAGEINALGISPGDPVLVQDCAIVVGGVRAGCGDAPAFRADFQDMSASTDCGASPAFRADFQDMSASTGYEAAPAFRFDFSAAFRQDLKLSTNLSPKMRTYLKEEILRTLSCRDAGSFELLFADRPADKNRIEETPFLMVAQKRFTDTKHFLGEGNWSDAATALRALIGLGLGLTPGGDDFLCGVLAGSILADQTAHPFASCLASQIREHLADTNDISAAFLSCALIGQFSLAVNRLTSLPSSEEMLSIFCEIGHSSGTDTLCGVYFALECAEYFL